MRGRIDSITLKAKLENVILSWDASDAKAATYIRVPEMEVLTILILPSTGYYFQGLKRVNIHVSELQILTIPAPPRPLPVVKRKIISILIHTFRYQPNSSLLQPLKLPKENHQTKVRGT